MSAVVGFTQRARVDRTSAKKRERLCARESPIRRVEQILSACFDARRKSRLRRSARNARYAAEKN